MHKLIFYDNFKEERILYVRLNLVGIIYFLSIINILWISMLVNGGIKQLGNIIFVIVNLVYIYWTIYSLLWLAKYEIFAYGDKIIVRSVYGKYTVMLNEIKSYEYKTWGNSYKITIFLSDNRLHLFEFTKRKIIIYTKHYNEFAKMLRM